MGVQPRNTRSVLALVLSNVLGGVGVASGIAVGALLVASMSSEAFAGVGQALGVLGAGLLAYAALFQLTDAFQVIALGFLRGVHDTRVPMWIAGFSYWVVGIPVAWGLAFPGGFGPAGLWLGLCVGLAFASVLLMARFWGGHARGVWTRQAVAV